MQTIVAPLANPPRSTDISTLSIDIESFSSVDLIKCGVYAYVEAPDFEIMLFQYSVDGGPVQIVDRISGEEIPEEILEAVFDPAVIKTAYNANFERTCLAKFYNRPCPPEQWRCTSVLGLSLGMPGNLFDLCQVVKLDADKAKMGVGRSLIRFFCIPCKPTKKNGQRTRNYPHHDPERWALFKEYAVQDVVAEMAVRDKLIRWDLPEHEWALWCLDQKINDRGARVDLDLVRAAIEIDAEARAKLTQRFVEITGITKATQIKKLKEWLSEEHDIEVESLNKEAVKDILKTTDEQLVIEALRLRQELSKSSVAKYHAIARSVCQDGAVRGLFQFCGANRTWRWAGRIVQMQNLPKSELSLNDLALARELVKAKDTETIELLFGPVPMLLSELIRTAFIARPGKVFTPVDFAAIEARVVAWLAGCQWRLEVFKTHGKIYEASAEQMFKLPPGSVGKKSPYRQKGKIAELALGYLGGVGALITMGALKMGLTEDELPGIVKAWRAANPEIVDFAHEMERNAKITLRQKITTGVPGKYQFRYQSGMLFMDLPSGRSLCYVKPRIEKDGDFTNITYDGLDQETKRWGRQKTYAGKLLENLTQAIARDCLGHVLPILEENGLASVGHVHDEDIPEVDEDLAEEKLAFAEEVMGRPIPWAPGLPLGGDGFISKFYRKG